MSDRFYGSGEKESGGGFVSFFNSMGGQNERYAFSELTKFGMFQIAVYRAKPVTPPKGAYRSVSGKARTEYRVRREPAHISNAERRISTKHFLSICTHSGARYTARPRPSRFDMPLRWLDMRPWGRENSPTNPNLNHFYPSPSFIFQGSLLTRAPFGVIRSRLDRMD